MKRSVSEWLRVPGALVFSIVCLRAADPFPSPPGITEQSDSQALAIEEGQPATSNSSSTESNRLWLEISGVSNEIVHLILHGTKPFEAYDVHSKEGLLNAWVHETTFSGLEGVDRTAFLVPMSGRTNGLFFRACSHPTEDGVDLPLGHLQLWLRADAGVEQGETNGAVSRWRDQSGHGNDATQASSASQPLWVDAVVNGRSVLRFTPNRFLRLPDFLSTNGAGEVFAVLKAATNLPTSHRALWRFGQPSGGYFPSKAGSGGYISASFGRDSIILNTGTPIQSINQFHLYNAASEPGTWISRINGRTHYETSDVGVGFNNQPYLGYNGSSTFFEGDVAELMLFDRVLTAGERDDVGRYLNQKYEWITLPPHAPEGLSAIAVASNQVSLQWTYSAPTETTVYTVERKEGVGGSYAMVAEVRDTTAHLDTGVEANKTYHYRLKARNYAGESTHSSEASATTPAAVSGLPLDHLQVWLKADAGVLQNGTNARVMIWQDQSGNGNHASQTGSAQQPSLLTAVRNGHPVVRFNPTTYERMRLPDFVSANSAGEIFAVIRAATNDPPQSRGLWRFGTSGAAGYYPSISESIYEGFGRNDNLNTGIPAQPINVFHLYNVSASTSEWISRINGHTHYSTTITSLAFPGTVWLGSSGQYGTPTFDGDIAELLVFDRVLTTGERASVGRYLNSRHAFVELSAGKIDLTTQTLSSSQIALSWSQEGATNQELHTYTVDRMGETNGSYEAIAQVNGDTRYFDGGLAPDTTYSYRVRNTFITESDPSNAAAATTLATGSEMPLSDVALWFRADALAVSLTNGEAVAEWPDFWNPHQKAVQADPSWQPAWMTTNLNGHASVEFGGGTFLELPPVLSGLTSAEVFVVLKSGTNTPAANQGLWKFNNNEATWFPDTNGVVQDAFGSPTARSILSPLPDLTRGLIYSVSADSDLWQSRMNGPLKQWITNNSVAFDGVPWLGRSSGGTSEPYAGHIAELIVFNRALDLGEQKTVRDGLALKYGIPLEHPELPNDLSLVRTNDTDSLLTWAALTGSENGLESCFVVERQSDTNGPFVPIAILARIATSSWDGSGLAGIDSLYRLRAINDVGTVTSEPLSASLTDGDGDGLPDALEAILGTNPNDSDTDRDGLPDGWEVEHGLNPLRADGIHGALGDADNDGITNLDEHENGTNPVDGVDGDSPLIRLRLHRPN